jgi:hypothetical protein
LFGFAAYITDPSNQFDELLLFHELHLLSLGQLGDSLEQTIGISHFRLALHLDFFFRNQQLLDFSVLTSTLSWMLHIV